jgi:hypothetical protein
MRKLPTPTLFEVTFLASPGDRDGVWPTANSGIQSFHQKHQRKSLWKVGESVFKLIGVLCTFRFKRRAEGYAEHLHFLSPR